VVVGIRDALAILINELKYQEQSKSEPYFLISNIPRFKKYLLALVPCLYEYFCSFRQHLVVSISFSKIAAIGKSQRFQKKKIPPHIYFKNYKTHVKFFLSDDLNALPG
jgi:hypothetical protein